METSTVNACIPDSLRLHILFAAVAFYGVSSAKVSFAEHVDGRERRMPKRVNIADRKRSKRQQLASIKSEVVESAVKADVILEAQQLRVASVLPRAVQAYEAFRHIPFGRASKGQVARSSAGIEGWGHVADVLVGVHDDSEDVLRDLVPKCIELLTKRDHRKQEKEREKNSQNKVTKKE